MVLLDMFGSEVWKGKHPALILGWRDDQLAPVVDVLDPLLLDNLTAEMKCAVAACARSLVVESHLSGLWVRYSRRNEHYSKPERYRRDNRYYTWYFVTRAMDVLEHGGLIDHEDGVWLPGGRGRQSIAQANRRLRGLLDSVIDVRESPGELRTAEVIVLRDRDHKKYIDYDDTTETVAMRAEVEALNGALGQLHLYWLGERFPIPPLRRIFNGDICRGGRCYCRGTSFQNIRAECRLDLMLLIDGVLRPVVEIDYANLHAVMAYTEAGLSIPPGDQYQIDGFDRMVVKRAFNVLLNATARHKAVAALVEDLHHKDDELWLHSGLVTRHRPECGPFAKEIVAAVEDRHRAIGEYFGSDCGAAFMRRDSDMAVRVMLRMIERTGRCPLPIHDSFLVADIDQEALAFTMQEVALEEGLVLRLKVSGGSAPLPPSASPLSLSWG